MSEALEKAKETIYICDWWLSPELFLRRPPHKYKEWGLDSVLKRRAEAGVKIYVSVYREVEAALTCNSRHTKQVLMNLCPEGTPGHGNIIVQRHPDHNVFENAADMTFYWAHHEKFIVIDYEMAFIGGLDLCFGRWDMHQHPLADLHPTGVEDNIWPGQDFNNNRIMDFQVCSIAPSRKFTTANSPQNVQDWRQNELNKSENGRMPWHDVAMGLIGPCVYDIAEHFVLRWNFIKRDKYKRDSRYDWLMLRGREGEDEDLVGVQRPKHPVGDYILHPISDLESKNLNGRGTIRAQIVRSSADWSSGILTDHSIQNAYAEVIRKAEHFVYIENQFFITATGDRQSPVHNTIGAAMVEAVLRAAKEGRTFRIIVLIPAVPGFAGDLRSDAATGTRAIMDYQYKSICRGEDSIFGRIRAEGVDPEKYLFFFNLRSYDRVAKTRAIKETEEATGIKYADVQRGAAEELMPSAIHQERDRGERRSFSPKREKTARERTEKETEEDEEAKAKKDKFEETLRGREKDPARISATVAHHAMADGIEGEGLKDEPWDEGDEQTEVENWIQEELYIHSKLLIADDRVVICGSSNLNDRSQMGNHDSELSIVMEDTRLVDSTMDGKPFKAGWHATTLRRYLWREHMGLLPAQDPDASGDINAQPPGENSPNNPWDKESSYKFVEDPLGEEMWSEWTGRATENSAIFRHLFHADPDDHGRFPFPFFDLFDLSLRNPPSGVKVNEVQCFFFTDICG